MKPGDEVVGQDGRAYVIVPIVEHLLGINYIRECEVCDMRNHDYDGSCCYVGGIRRCIIELGQSPCGLTLKLKE